MRLEGRAEQTTLQPFSWEWFQALNASLTEQEAQNLARSFEALLAGGADEKTILERFARDGTPHQEQPGIKVVTDSYNILTGALGPSARTPAGVMIALDLTAALSTYAKAKLAAPGKGPLILDDVEYHVSGETS